MHVRELPHATRHTDLESRQEKEEAPASHGGMIQLRRAAHARSRDEIKVAGPITVARPAAVESLYSILRSILSRFSIDERIEDHPLS